MIVKKIFITFLLLLMTSLCFAGERLDLYVGEIKILKVGNIERIAVGNSKLLSTSMLNNGQLLILAEGEGSSKLHIWFSNGKERGYTIYINAKSENLISRKIEIEKMLSDISGLEVSIIGDKIVLSGLIAYGHEATIKKVTDTFEEVMVAVNFAVNELVRKKLEVEDLLSDVEGFSTRIVGERIVLSGLVDSGHKETIEKVVTEIGNILDLIKYASLDMDMPENKMVLMSIKITEFNKNYLENLGIAWDSAITGPAAAFALDGATNSVFRGTGLPNPSFNGSLTPGNAISPLGYFGIATEITSRINFAVNSGNALILAEPRLAARSGGEASFLAGGEFPIESSSINGTTVEFKQFGIGLTVKPTVDRNDNIHANVITELSAIDNSVAVNGIPGLITRQTSADVILASGETLVMSGLINQEASKDTSGIKFLSEIPILGELFKSKTFRDKKSELVIFVTPTLFDAKSKINSNALDYANEGIESVIEAIDESSLNIVY